MEMKAREWLEQWQNFINASDFLGAREMFSENVTAFGTVAGSVQGLNELEARQWRIVWPRIKNFRFGTPVVVTSTATTHGLAITWSSLGVAASGRLYPRSGRATLLLQDMGGHLVCVHSHFSMEPGAPALE